MLEEYLRRFLEHLRYERNVSQHTLRNYSSDLEQFHLAIAPPKPDGTRQQIHVKDIDHLTIREWMANLHGLNKRRLRLPENLPL
jgi:integrase/recombinase XerC